MQTCVRAITSSCVFLLLLAGAAFAAGAPEGVSLTIEPSKKEAYPGETIPVRVSLRAEGVTVRNISYPRLGGTFKSSLFEAPRQSQEGAAGPSAVTVYSFNSSITPTAPGTIAIGPATLQCEIVESEEGRASYFGEVTARPVTVTSPAASVTALPYPTSRRPAGFNGAVGRFTLARTASPTAVNAGDPVTVETTVKGNGNLADIACPPAGAPNLRGYPPRRALAKDVLTCEEVVIPQSLPASIPAASIVSFDPQSREYRKATTAAIPLHPLQPRSAPRPAPLPPGQGAGRPAAAGDPKTAPPLYVALAVAFPFAAVIVVTGYRRLRPVEEPAPCCDHHADSDSFLTAAEQALAQCDTDSFYTALFRGVQRHLAERLDVPAQSVTSTSFPEDAVAAQLLAQCDLVRYGNHAPDRSEMTRDHELFRRALRLTPDLPPHHRRNP